MPFTGFSRIITTEPQLAPNVITTGPEFASGYDNRPNILPSLSPDHSPGASQEPRVMTFWASRYDFVMMPGAS